MESLAGAPTRLDLALVARGLAPSRARAQALVAAGMVRVGGATARTAAQPVGDADDLALAGRDHPWASRGGLKLVAALDGFGVDPAQRVVLDAGASTGGFTDVLLARGARLVHAVDVGYGQLLSRLADDERVHVVDRTNLRLLGALAGEPPSLVTLDLSFISLRLVLPRVAALAAPGAEVIALVKPQFELGREAVGRGGVVRDLAAGEESARQLLAWASSELGSVGAGPLASPVRGGQGRAQGNQEWLIHLRLPSPPPHPEPGQ